MVSAVEEIAAARGFAPEQVRKELYWPKGRAHWRDGGAALVLPDHRDLLPEPGAAAALAVRGVRGRCAGPLPPPPGRRHALPDRDGRALGAGRAAGARARRASRSDLVDGWAATWQRDVRSLRDQLDRFIRTTDPDHVRASHRDGDARAGRAATSTRAPTPAGTAPATTSSRPMRSSSTAAARTIRRSSSSGWRRRTTSSACPPTRSGSRRSTRDNPSFCEPEHYRNEVLAWLREGLRDFSISRAGTTVGHPVPGRSGASDLRLVRRADQLRHRRRLPGRSGASFERWWPADVHVIGKNITRFHCLYWPAMLMSAGLAAAAPGLRPRLHDPARREDEQDARQRLDPDDAVALFGVDGIALPRPARDPVRP